MADYNEDINGLSASLSEISFHVDVIVQDIQKRKRREKRVVAVLCGLLILGAFWFYSNSVYETGRKNGATEIFHKFAQTLKDNPSICVSDGENIQCAPVPQSSGADMSRAGYSGQQ